MKHFSPGWKMTLFVVCLLPLVCSLGVWQLSRGAEKRALESDYLASLTSLPSAITASTLERPFERVRLRGEFSTEVYLVDNQIHAGNTGYWVLQVFDHSTGGRYLLNRGFIKGAPTRAQLPDIAVPSGEQNLVGVIWPDTGLIPVLDEDLWPSTWPKRVQRLDVKRMAAEVGATPVEIRLEPGQAGVDQAAPFASVLSDAKHLGYAATWFGLAIALVVGYLVFGFRQGRDSAFEYSTR